MVNNQRPSASKQAAASQNFQKQGSKYSFSVVVWILGFQPNIPLPEKNNYKCIYIYICMSGSICSIICILGRTGNLKRLCSNASKDKPHMILTQHRSFREVFTKGVETLRKLEKFQQYSALTESCLQNSFPFLNMMVIIWFWGIPFGDMTHALKFSF